MCEQTFVGNTVNPLYIGVQYIQLCVILLISTHADLFATFNFG